MSERTLQIRCLDCIRDEAHPHLPLLWNAGTCNECATSSVTKHLVEFPGHRCTVLGKNEEPVLESKSTVRLLRKAQGW